MLSIRRQISTSAYLLLLAGGCEPGVYHSQAPPFVPLAEHIAIDSQFALDGVDITNGRAEAEANSEHVFAASTRLQELARFKDGVLCRLRILGVNRDGVVVNCGYTTKVVKPDREGRVSIEDTLETPRGPGEYEIQIEVYEGKDHFAVGRVPLFVVPASDSEADQGSET